MVMNKINPIGAPTKYTPYIAYIICKSLKEGMFREDSVRLAGIVPKTFYQWLAKYPEFSKAVDEAESMNVRSLARQLLKHGKHSWQAIAWYLERRHSNYFGARSATLISSDREGFKVAVIQGGYTPQLTEAKPQGDPSPHEGSGK